MNLSEEIPDRGRTKKKLNNNSFQISQIYFTPVDFFLGGRGGRGREMHKGGSRGKLGEQGGYTRGQAGGGEVGGEPG